MSSNFKFIRIRYKRKARNLNELKVLVHVLMLMVDQLNVVRLICGPDIIIKCRLGKSTIVCNSKKPALLAQSTCM